MLIEEMGKKFPSVITSAYCSTISEHFYKKNKQIQEIAF